MNFGALLAAIGSAWMAAGSALLVYEAWAVQTRKAPPITFYVRAGERAHPHWAAMVSIIVAALLGHFYWH